MPSLLLDDDQRPLGGGLLGLGAPRIEAADVTPADAADVTAQQVGDFVDKQRAISAQRGLWDDASGLPTQKGLLDAAQQTAQGLLFGTTAPKPGFTAFHGSPYDFNAFDASKIGTGEGQQAFGHGMYLAENEGVAQGYKRDLAQTISVDGKPILQNNKMVGSTGNSSVDDILIAHGGDLDAAIADHKAHMASLTPGQIARGGVDTELAGLEALRGRVDSRNTGHMYEVGVSADPAHFLDWDRPLSEQHPKVQEALAKLPWAEPYLQSGKFTGGQLAPTTHEGAVAMRDAGIPGIRYLDAGSRGAGTGSSNYVIFDPATMAILRKYGLAGLMAGGAGAAASRGNGS